MTQPDRQHLEHLKRDHGWTVRDIARFYGISERIVHAQLEQQRNAALMRTGGAYRLGDVHPATRPIMPLDENDRKRPPSRSVSHAAAQTRPRVLANGNIRRNQRRVSAPNTLVIAGNEIIDALLAGIFFV